MKPTYIFDFDSTLVCVETLDELARIALADTQDRESVLASLQALTERGMSGELPFDKSLEQRLELFHANKNHIAALTSRLADWLSPSAMANVEWFKQNKEHIYVVSGGFADYIVPAMEHLGILPNHVYANHFKYDNSGEIVGYDQTRFLCRAQGKVKQVAALALPRPIIVIGDGYTDYEIRKAGEADEFWAITESITRPNVVKVADKVLANFTDLPYTS